jgi:phage repressor protein C with HTH and peptisase S24 domain
MEKETILKEIRQRLGLSQAKAAERIGVSQQHYQRLENGYPIKLNLIEKISQVFGVDKASLLPAHFIGVAEAANQVENAIPKFREDEVIIEMIDATACCGDGVDNLPEKVCGHWHLPTAEFKTITSVNPSNIKMLRVQGDSMQPTINEGDWVWVDISNNFISSDGMYLIKMHTGLAVKRLQSGLSNIVIKSDNASYSDITADVGEVQIVGKVVYILNGRRV